MFGGTVIIDDPDKGGSDPGAWLTHIAHTPALKRQLELEAAPPAAAVTASLEAVAAVSEAGE